VILVHQGSLLISAGGMSGRSPDGSVKGLREKLLPPPRPPLGAPKGLPTGADEEGPKGLTGVLLAMSAEGGFGWGA
jgi:hypothetical protein